jgi:hypothetical protein
MFRASPNPAKENPAMPRNTVLQPTRPKQPVNPSLDKKLVAYVTAAGAAGVAILAAATPANAEIVYTPEHVILKGNSTYQIDLNHDGTNDFGIQMFQIFHSSMMLAIPDVTGNQVVRPAVGSNDAVPLNLGGPIGPNRQFASKTTYGGFFMAINGSYGTLTWFRGPWAKASNKYLGLKFLIDGEVHYGWVRLSVMKRYSTLTGYAYETVANQPIRAGAESGTDATAAAYPDQLVEPASPMATLGMMARGADGLALWRRDEEAA